MKNVLRYGSWLLCTAAALLCGTACISGTDAMADFQSMRSISQMKDVRALDMTFATTRNGKTHVDHELWTPGAWKIDVHSDDGKTTNLIYSGNSFFSIANGKSVKQGAMETESAQTALKMMFDPASAALSVTLKEERADGGKVFLLEFPQYQLEMTFNKDGDLIAKRTIPGLRTTIYSDYRKVDGKFLPHKIRIEPLTSAAPPPPAACTERIMKECKINPPVPANAFILPDTQQTQTTKQ